MIVQKRKLDSGAWPVGRPVPEKQRRSGILGAVDSISFSDFKALPNLVRKSVLAEGHARKFGGEDVNTFHQTHWTEYKMMGMVNTEKKRIMMLKNQRQKDIGMVHLIYTIHSDFNDYTPKTVKLQMELANDIQSPMMKADALTSVTSLLMSMRAYVYAYPLVLQLKELSENRVRGLKKRVAFWVALIEDRVNDPRLKAWAS